MNIQVENQVSVKIFVGCLLNSEMRMYLNSSRVWKQAALFKSTDLDLIEIHYQNKNYIGRYLSDSAIPLNLLKKTEKTVRQLIGRYCPECDPETLRICIFPQLFIA